MNGQIRVLIVDDEAVVRSTLKLASKNRKWQIDAVESAEEAIEVLREKRFDVVLVDKNLPGMSGVELVREIRKTDSEMGIIMMTEFASVDSAMETLHIGIDSYIEKPFDNIYDVIDKIEKVAIARRNKRHIDEHETISTHFSKAMETLHKSNEKIKKALWKSIDTMDRMYIVVASPFKFDREWMVQQFSNTTEVVAVSSAEEALELARKESPALLIVDISGQDPGVMETLRAIKDCAPVAGLIVLTEKRPPLNTITTCIELGVRIILEKPLSDRAAFRAKLESVTRRRRRRSELIQWSEGNP
jgi:DNA-binding response OmpR family regulator